MDYVGDSHSAILWTVIGIAILIIHFVPSFIAYSRQHPNRVLIVILNILMGWTVIGWVVLLVWANKK